MNVVNHFLSFAQKEPDQKALITHHRTISYGELSTLVEGKASYFVKKGVKEGDRILVFAPMSIDLYACILGLFKIGAVVVAVDEWSTKKRIKQSIKTAECSAILTSGKYRFLSYFFPETRKIELRLSPRGFSNINVNTKDLKEDSPALITFTTGSTNTPKAAVRTHGFLDIQLNTISSAKKSSPSDIEFTNLPILLLLNLANGSTSYIPKLNKRSFGESNWSDVSNCMSKHNVNCITCSPALLEELCNQHEMLDFSRIKKIFCGGGPVSPELAQKTTKCFKNAEAFAVYGSTEAEPISIISFSELMGNNILKDGGLCAGKIHDSIDCFIQPIIYEGETLPFGEILVAGEHVLDNYYKDIGRDESKVELDGTVWHKTGDLGFVRDQQLYFAGRLNHLIPSTKTPPIIVESQIENITGSEGALIEKDGKVILCITAKRTDNLSSLSKLFEFDRVLRIDSLPKDPRHQTKIDYNELRNQC